MTLTIRQETSSDYKSVFELIKEAFANEKYSDHKEQILVEKLRNSNSFIPELSIIAQIDDVIVGHILLTEIKIINKDNSIVSLALAPVSVMPKYQKQGIGGKLITHAHTLAKNLGYKSIILLGHEDYYPKFGYKQADKFQIKLPFDVPTENCMVIELIEDGLLNVNGIIEYPKEFME